MVFDQLGAGAAAADHALSVLKYLKNLVEGLKNVEVKEKLLELKEALLVLKEENLDLKQRVMELQAIQQQKENLELRNGMYWEQGKDIPLCQVCFDRDNTVVHLH